MVKLPNEIVGRALSDSDFRKRLFEEPAATLLAEGVEASPETVAALQNIDPLVIERFVEDAGGAAGANAMD